MIALALVVAGVTAAVLVRPPAAPGAGQADRRTAVTYGREALAESPCGAAACMAIPPAQGPWAEPPPPLPDGLGPGRAPPADAFAPGDDPLGRLRAAPAGFQPTAASLESATDLWSYGASVAPVPEPAGWMMALAGFGLVGLGRRRAYLATL